MESTSRTQLQKSFLSEPNIWAKLSRVERDLEGVLSNKLRHIPTLPGRDIQILPPLLHPNKAGLSTKPGQARLLHDLASIELQALELGLRTLIEYSEAPELFRVQLAEITKGEANHLRLCLEALSDLGFSWGDFPVHTGLWQAVGTEDSLIDRVLIVHWYFEGSGLDAGETLVRRLHGLNQKTPVHSVVGQIVREEIDHVQFGTSWYRKLCEVEKINPNEDFKVRLERLRPKLPKRLEIISEELRSQAGFSRDEILYLQNLRERISKFSGRVRQIETLPSVLSLLSGDEKWI